MSAGAGSSPATDKSGSRYPREFTYLCPGCGGVEMHVGGVLSECKDWYFGCPTFAVAVAWRDNQPMKGSQLNMLPDRPKA